MRKQSGLVFWIASLTLAMTNVAHAQTYKPGSIGYVYEDCAKALVLSASPKDFFNTYCGGFVEGYGMGVLSANNINLGQPNPLDPCAGQKKKEYARIEARLCENLPDFRSGKTPPGIILQTAAEIVARWKNYLKKSKKLDLLRKPAIPEINALVTPGKFCDEQARALANSDPVKINESLLRANWYDFVRSGTGTLAHKYDRCKKDLDGKNFISTRCGAEITGFIAGLYSTAHLQKRPPVKGACKKEIDRLYNSLDMAGTMCLKADINPVLPAQLFLQRVDSLRAAGRNLNEPGLGAAGYQSIYYGLLCRGSKSE